jgi:hypothetical protein
VTVDGNSLWQQGGNINVANTAMRMADHDSFGWEGASFAGCGGETARCTLTMHFEADRDARKPS